MEKETTYLEAIREAMWEEMKTDESVFILGEDVGVYGGAFKATQGFLEEFGAERVIDTPISEAAIVGAAIGAAHMGLKPIAEMQFIDFIAPAFDMIVNFAAKSRYRTGVGAGLVIRGPCGGGARSGPFHSQNVESYFANVAGLKLVAPATARDAKGLLRSAIRDPDPVLYFEHKFLYRRIKESLPVDEEIIVPIGKARTHREGSDLTIVTYGAMVYKCAEVAELIEAISGKAPSDQRASRSSTCARFDRSTSVRSPEASGRRDGCSLPTRHRGSAVSRARSRHRCARKRSSGWMRRSAGSPRSTRRCRTHRPWRIITCRRKTISPPPRGGCWPIDGIADGTQQTQHGRSKCPRLT